MPASLWSLLLYAGLVGALVVGVLLLSWLVGERHRAPMRDVPYESGVTPTGNARLRFGAHYYLVAVFFLLFDLEAVFLFAWAVALRDVGWLGFVVATLFIVTLAEGLVYIWKEGGLDWNPRRRDAAGPRV